MLDDSSRVTVAYSEGRSLGISSAMACFGRAEGTLRVSPGPFGRKIADLSVRVRAMGDINFCDDKEFRLRLVLRPMSIESLTPWLGGCEAQDGTSDENFPWYLRPTRAGRCS